MVARLLALIGLLLLPAIAHAAESGGLRGSVYDRDFEVPLGEAQLSVLEAHAGAVTSADGSFLFERLPPGVYTVRVAKPGYETQLLEDVVVVGGRLTDLRVDLVSEVIDMDELVVTGADLLADTELGVLELRAESLTLEDSISSEAISKAGVADVAGALKLVVGASVVEGKYATVRGLSDRYTGTTLNGVRVPSADPRRRAVQVDMFPTGTIESVTVTKTFTPDKLGDFTGGGVDIKTKAIPDKRVLAFTLSTEYDSFATNNSSFLRYAAGGVESLGFHRSDRNLPPAALEPLPKSLTALGIGFDPAAEDIEAAAAFDAFAHSFAPTMGVSREAPGANSGYALVAGNRYELGGKPLGVMTALTYTHKYELYEDGLNNSGRISVAGTPPAVTERTESLGTEEVLWSGLANFSLTPDPEHEISLKLIYNHSATDEARFQETTIDSTEDKVSVEQNQTLHYTERAVGSTQLHGLHHLGDFWSAGEPAASDLSLDWVLSYNFTRQEEPDVRFFRNYFEFDFVTGMGSALSVANTTAPERTRRIFREIEEDNVQGAVNAVLPFDQWSGLQGEVRAGLYDDETDRDFFERSFHYNFAPQAGSFFNPTLFENLAHASFQTEDPEGLWTDAFASPDNIGLATNRCSEPPANPTFADCAALNQLLWILEPRGDDVDYTGDQQIKAAYAMADLPLLAKLTLVAGARYETTSMSVVPTSATGLVDTIETRPSGDRAIVEVPQEEMSAEIDEHSLLPSVGLIYEIIPNMKLRGSWSETIARPTFRELAPVATEEFLAGDAYIGNPDLVLSDIENTDLRWEWFRRPGQLFAVSLFRKEITNPIELINFSSGSNGFIRPLNYERGDVSGGELEVRSGFGELADWLDGLAVGANYTLLDSEVEVPEQEQAALRTFGLDEEVRRLQGQPEYLLNAHLTYDNERIGTSVGAFYNIVGETLLTGAARGEDGSPSVFSKPFVTLDMKATQRLQKHLSLSLSAKNMLRDEIVTVYRTPDDAETVKTKRRTAFRGSVALKVEW